MGIEDSTNFRRIDERLTTSGIVAAESLQGLRAAGYDVVVNLLPDDSPYAVAGEEEFVRGQGVTYVPIPVDFAAPTRDDLERFFAALDAHPDEQVHVHCAVNARVSAFMGLYQLRQGNWDVARCDAHLREIWDPAEYPVWEAFLAEQRARLAAEA